MGRCSLIRLMNDTIEAAMTEHQRLSAERHGQRKKSARLLCNSTERTGISIHFASHSGKEALTECRPNDVNCRAKAAIAGFKKNLKFRAVAPSPRTRIKTNQQLSQPGIHKTSNLLSPALLNRCRTVNFARKTRSP